MTEEIRAEFKEAADFINKIIYNDLPASLKNDEKMYKFACINGFGREYVCDRAIADGWLHYDADTKDAVGAYMYI